MHYRVLLSSALAAAFATSVALPQVDKEFTSGNAEVIVSTIDAVEVDNNCGPEVNKICDPKTPGGGACCSPWGYCGNGPFYCGSGCQNAFSHNGQCKPNSGVVHKPGKIHRCGAHAKNKKCPQGLCCSVNGFCGKSQNFCGTTCQEKFGLCHKDLSHTTKGVAGDRCGPRHHNRQCGGSLCCSRAGYCGKGRSYCSVPQNCQRQFGWCDSMAAPHGYNTSADIRRFPTSTHIQTPILKCTQPHTLALTFDDGPTKYTHELLQLLKHYDARGTFFLGGNINGKGQIDVKWKEPVRRMVAKGHQVASHSWSHPNLTQLPTYLRREEMVKNERAITNIIGKYPSFMRAPYISCDPGCQKDMRDLGYFVANWQWDSEDWRGKSASKTAKKRFDSVFDNIKDKPNASLFVIQHDLHRSSLSLTKHILKKVQKTKDWKVVPLVECLGLSLDNAYRYPTWLEPATVSKGACLVSGVNYCITIKAFKNKRECETSLKQTNRLVATCKSRNKGNKYFLQPVANDCKQADNIAQQQLNFCKACDDKHGACDISKFRVKAWQPSP